jgi:putative DNA primase/helicase
MVTAHENDEAATLREGFVKQATGGDTLKGRWMRADFFEFKPTHKLQLLTNHRPVIKGQDFGIWRRILLVDYPVKFGSKEDVAEGRATNEKDTTLPDTLRQESEGILAWIVRGAIEWYRDGLKLPDSVIASGRAYQSEQDRARQFVDECCILDEHTWSAFTGGFGLYPAYKSWCQVSGYSALGKGRFIQELERVVPFFRKAENKRMEGGVRKTLNGAYGLRVNFDGDGGGEVIKQLAEIKPALLEPLTPDNSDLVGVTS